MKKALFVTFLLSPLFLFAQSMHQLQPQLAVGSLFPPLDFKTIDTRSQHYPFSLPPLSFATNALNPYLDTKTVELHYNLLHKAYVDNLNKALSGTPWEKSSLKELFINGSKLPVKIKNMAGGYWNHSFYWYCLTLPTPIKTVPEPISSSIIKDFGSVEGFKNHFKEEALNLFGSGWVWLIQDKTGKLVIVTTPNQDNPMMDFSPVQGKPLLTCDLWEHAYYLQYQNHRGDYIDAFWNLVDWDKVNDLFTRKD